MDTANDLPAEKKGYGNDTGYAQQPDTSEPEDARARPMAPSDPATAGSTTGTSGDARPVSQDDPDNVGGTEDAARGAETGHA